MTDEINPNAVQFENYWPPRHIHYSDRWREVRHLVAIGGRNGTPIGFDANSEGVSP